GAAQSVLLLRGSFRHTELMPEKLILAIDVGNTRIKFGVFECADFRESTPALPKCIASLAVSVADEFDWRKVTAHFDEWSANLAQASVAGANPSGVGMILSGWPDKIWPAPVVVRRAAELPLRVNL